MSRKVDAVQFATPPAAVEPTAQSLVAEHYSLQGFAEEQQKRFDEHMKPTRERLEAISNALLEMSNTQKWDSIKTDAGTAYRKTTTSVAIEAETPYVNERGVEVLGREALLDFALEHWEAIGGELLMVRPQVDAVRRWMDEHEGQPPPGCKVSAFTKIHYRKA